VLLLLLLLQTLEWTKSSIHSAPNWLSKLQVFYSSHYLIQGLSIQQVSIHQENWQHQHWQQQQQQHWQETWPSWQNPSSSITTRSLHFFSQAWDLQVLAVQEWPLSLTLITKKTIRTEMTCVLPWNTSGDIYSGKVEFVF